MTIATTRPDASGIAVLRRAATGGAVTAVICAIAAVIGWGPTALMGAVIGSAAAVVILGAGTWAVLVVAGRNPTMSLLVALVVYTAQGLLLALVLGLISWLTDRSELVAAALSVCVVTFVWTVGFAIFVKRARIVLFELPSREAP